jgi:hypothetical protein
MNSMNENPDQAPPPAALDKGSLLIGFLVGWAAMIAGTVVAATIMSGAGAFMSGGGSSAFGLIAGLAGLLPMASLIGLIIWYAVKGKSRSALGVAAAFGSLLALCLLLVAACFGLMSGTNFGR